MSKKHELLVAKHNSLIEASYKLNLNEQRLVLSCIAQLDSRRPLKRDNLFTITAKEFASAYGIEEKHAYEALEMAAGSLYERDIKTYDGKYRERFRWVYCVRYHDGEGKVTMGFSPSVTPYLTMLHKRFTSYKLKQIANLTSVYSIRLLEFLMQFRATGKLVISINKFKELLDLKAKYNRFYDLKVWVIEPAVTELQKKSGLDIEWKPVREGKTIKQLEFCFSEINLTP